MRFLLIAISLAFIACSAAQDGEPGSELEQDSIAPKQENPKEISASLQVLRERSAYAALDKQAVEEIAHAAETHWPQEFSGFSFQGVEHFSAGGVSHWMSIWRHSKTGLEFVLLPGGKFPMGSPLSEADRREDELQNWVTLDPFLVARTECTIKAWVRGASAAGKVGNLLLGSDQLPISGIGPVDVEFWCEEASLSFPTEAQWEYLCRGGTTTPWAMGANKEDLVHFGNLGSLECPDDWKGVKGITESWYDGYGNETAEVGSFQCNAFGLFDVHGNLNEWCRDYYFDYTEVPAEGGAGMRRGSSGERLARGGSYGGGASAARSAKRLTAGTGGSAGEGGNHGFGFRPSVDLPY